jgi:aspartate aminotransferase/aminotransferase
MVQHAAVAAFDVAMDLHVADYRRKRDRVHAALREFLEVRPAGGAFYFFPGTPWGTGTEFVTECIQHNLLLIPGGVFSARDTHFRLSYAAEDATLEQGLEVLRKVAKGTAGRVMRSS